MYAMAIPIIQNKVPAWKAWIRECTESRKEEFEAFNERMELTLHRVWLTQGREGPLAIVVVDGPGAKDYTRKLASSKEPFDRWFRERVTEYHGADFSKLEAVPPSEMYLDWHVPSYVEAGR
jgi:hypothetical protein